MAALASVALALAAVGTQAKTLRFEFKTQNDIKTWKALGAKWFISNRGYGPEKAIWPGSSWTALLNTTRKFYDIDLIYTATPQAKGVGFTSAVWLRAGYKLENGVYNVKGYYIYAFLDQPNDTISVAISRSNRFPQTVNPDTYNIQLCYKDIKGAKIDTHKIRVQAKGNKLKVLYRNKVICSATDDTYKIGYVGFSISNMRDLKYITSITRGEINYPSD
jgi:hypothetical protein